MSKPVLRLENVYRRYQQAERVIEVLSGASLELYPGQLTALVGPSGAGKTTLLNMAGLLERPDSGEVFVQQVATAKLSERRRTKLRGLHIGFVFQFHRLFPEFTAIENIVIAQMINQLPRSEAEERAQSLLAMVGLQDRGQHRPAQLSGGEQQRVRLRVQLPMPRKFCWQMSQPAILTRKQQIRFFRPCKSWCMAPKLPH